MTAMSQKLAALASTGNNTHAAVSVPSHAEAVSALFTVTVIGATPTVTYSVQGSDDGINFTPVQYITTSGSALGATPRVRTTVSTDLIHISSPRDRRYRFYRVVTSANTNVTYDADLITYDAAG